MCKVSFTFAAPNTQRLGSHGATEADASVEAAHEAEEKVGSVMVDVGDVLCVRTTGPFSWLIRLAARIQRKPATIDHVAIVHHIDADGTPWVVEAWAPQGVRLTNGTAYQASPSTITNVGQPKTAAQRAQVAEIAASLLRHGYDFAAIAQDAMAIFKIRDPLIEGWLPSKTPARFVCSSLAGWCYMLADLDEPDGGRFIAPADWAALILAHGWQNGSTS